MPDTRFKRLFVLAVIPCVALSLFARQVYLQYAHDLSVWKGGGMGMFAGIGAPHHRFLKITLEDPIGQRIVLVRFTGEHQRLISRLRSEPRDEHFRALATSLLETGWIVLSQTLLQTRFDSRGERIREPPRRSLSIAPATKPGQGWRPKAVEIAFWKITYDRATKTLGADLARTFSYPSGRQER